MKRVSSWEIMSITIISLLCIVMMYPFWQTVVASFMTESEYLSSSLKLYVTNPTLDAYRAIFKDGELFIHLRVTILITIVGTFASLLFTGFSAYGLSKSFRGSSIVMFLIVLTMFVNPGLIPEYLNYKSLGLINHFSVYILPALINTFYLIIMRSNFLEFPKELEEAAKMDGCSEFRIFFTIVVPLSKPLFASIGLFLAVGFWNTYMQSVFFVTDNNLKSAQEYLQRLVTDSSDIQGIMTSDTGALTYNVNTLRLANIVLVLVPIITVYPFLQKYFVQGLMIGSVKG